MDELCDYSLYDVNGDAYKVTVSRRQALVFDSDHVKCYRMLNKLKRQGVKPTRPDDGETSFNPIHNSTMRAMVQLCPSPSVDDLRSPSAKKGRITTLNESIQDLCVEDDDLAQPLDGEEGLEDEAEGRLSRTVTDENANITEVKTKAPGSCRVSNVPVDLEQDFLVPFIEAALESAGLDVAITSCNFIGDCTYELEFPTKEKARIAAMLDGLLYLDTALRFEEVELVDEALLKVHNVPPGKEGLVLKYLIAAFKRKGLSSDVVESLNTTNGITVMKVKDSTSATEIMHIKDVEFLGVTLTFSQYEREIYSIVEAVADKSAPLDKTITEAVADKSAPLEKTITQIVTVDSLGEAAAAEDNSMLRDASYLMKSTDGRELFLKKLLLTRSLFKNTRNYSSGFARLLGEIRKEKIDIDLKELQNRRKYWLDIHNNIKKGTVSSVYQNVLRVIFEYENITTLKGTQFEMVPHGDEPSLIGPGQIAATAALFSKGACFNNDGAKHLIKLVRMNYETLLGAKNTDHFWAQIALLMNDENHFGDGHACERKFQAAKKLYRDYVQARERTGAVGPACEQQQDKWYWNDDMHFIMEKDDIVNPPLTISAGSSNVFTAKEAGTLPKASGAPMIGRSKVPQLKRTKSKQDAKNDVLMEFVKAMNRRTDVLERQGQQQQAPAAGFRAEDEDEEEERRRLNTD